VGVSKNKSLGKREISYDEALYQASFYGFLYIEVQTDTHMNIQETVDMIALSMH
jgi:hypothetical protein